MAMGYGRPEGVEIAAHGGKIVRKYVIGQKRGEYGAAANRESVKHELRGGRRAMNA